MNKLSPSLKLLLTFFISFFVTYALLNLTIKQIKQREQQVHIEAAKILQQEITEQFQLVLDVTRIIGEMSSIYVFNNNKQDDSYGELLTKILNERKYILGLNQLDHNGKIITISPKESNQAALGKTSQNLSELIKSKERGDKFWFSPPFQLYQGGSGFVFYIPIKDKNKFLGWMAPVISSQRFFEHFRTSDFFNKYDLIIKDKATDNIYFSTGVAPKNEVIKEAQSRMWNRNIIFQTWPKQTNPQFALPFWLRFFICLLVSLFCGLMMKVRLQRNKAYMRLQDISGLLKLTSNEVLSNLMDIQKEYLANGSNGLEDNDSTRSDIQSATNLFEQIELLQNIAGSEHLDEETFEILPLIKEHLELISEVVSKKNLKLKLDAESFNEIKLTGNKWLISNTVLKNALSFSALVSRPDGMIEVTHSTTPKECSTIFHIEKIIADDMTKAFRIERRLMVAQNVMGLLNGEISIREDGAGGMIVKLSTEPIAKG